jgi:hypothetical protein
MDKKERKKLHRLWLTLPNEALKKEYKDILTKDFGSSGLGLYALATMYCRPDKALHLAEIRKVFETLRNSTENTKEVYKLKKEIEAMKAELKAERLREEKKHNKEEVLKDGEEKEDEGTEFDF